MEDDKILIILCHGELSFHGVQNTPDSMANTEHSNLEARLDLLAWLTLRKKI